MKKRLAKQKVDWFKSEINEFIHNSRFNQAINIGGMPASIEQHVSPFQNFGNFEKDVEHSDMKYLFRLIDLDP
jgi:hypothetical protein